MTLAEKILARASGKNEVKPGEYMIANIDLAMAHDGLGGVARILNEAGIKKLWDPDKVVSLLDHSTPAPTVQAAEGHKMIENAVRAFNIRNFYGQAAGICRFTYHYLRCPGSCRYRNRFFRNGLCIGNGQALVYGAGNN